MWRDPLDELIEDLERALPTPSTQVDASMSFVDLQHYVSVALYGTEEDQARAERERWYQRVEKRFAETAERGAARRGHARPTRPRVVRT